MNNQTLRIIAGKWRKLKLTFPAKANIRPTPNRVRETAFSWLDSYIMLQNARCLDAFAGSGALGFEALSRGAREVTMLETDRTVFKSLQRHANTLQCQQQVKSYCQDALRFLDHAPARAFNIIFLDPPFDQDLMASCLRLITKHHHLAANGMLYLEAASDMSALAEQYDNWQVLKCKKAGRVHFALWQNNDSRPASSAG